MALSKKKFAVASALMVLLHSTVFSQVTGPSSATAPSPGVAGPYSQSAAGVASPQAPAPSFSNGAGPAFSGVSNPFYSGVASSFDPEAVSSNQGFSVLPSSYLASSPLSLGLPIRPLKVAFSISEGYDSNVNSSNTNIVSGFFTNFAGHAAYNFGGPRLQLSTGVDGSIAYYPTIKNNNVQPFGDLYLNANYKAAPRLTLSTTNLLSYYSQPQLGVPGVDATSNDYFYFVDNLSATYQLSPILSSVTGYSLNVVYYTGVSSGDQLGYISQTVTQSANWLIFPKTTFVVEYMANPITYFVLPQNSFSNFALVGINQVFNTRAYWSLRIGAQTTNSEDSGNGQNTFTLSPYMQSTFSYRLGPASTVSWTMNYGTQPSGTSNVTNRQSFYTSINWAQALTGRLSLNFGFNYQNNYYSATDFTDAGSQNAFGVTVGLNFMINRLVSLSAGYNFTDSMSPEDISTPYVRSQVFFGANLAF